MRRAPLWLQTTTETNGTSAGAFGVYQARAVATNSWSPIARACPFSPLRRLSAPSSARPSAKNFPSMRGLGVARVIAAGGIDRPRGAASRGTLASYGWSFDVFPSRKA